jgi:hypothetical protein
MIKKRNVLLFSSLLIIGLLAINFVSAYSYSYGFSAFNMKDAVENLINMVTDFSSPFLQVILGGDYWSTNLGGTILFEKFLLFILIVAIVYVAIYKVDLFKDKKAVIWTVSIVVPILSVRYIDGEWLNTILGAYQVFGIAMTTLLPLIIYFFFLMNSLRDHPAMRKIGWILFICVYLGIYTTTDRVNYSQWYLITGGIAFLLLLADGTIERYMVKQEWKSAEMNSQSEALAHLNKRIAVVEGDGSLPNKERLLKALYEQKEYLLKGAFGKWGSSRV